MSDNLASSIQTAFAQIDLTDREFDRIAALVYQLSGINLTEKKRQLVIGRLGKRLKLHSLKTFSDYIALLEGPGGQVELREFINQITTNKTDFFREDHHFQYLRQHFIPELLAKGVRNLRFWSAGCSTGEEPYTLAITVLEALRENGATAAGMDVKILATDLDTNVLAAAERGVYTNEKLAPVPAELRKQYFRPVDARNSEATPALKSLIRFGRLNLMNPYPFRHGFNAVFCRNVLIYFKNEDRKAIISKIYEHIRPGGMLLLGHSESLLLDSHGLKNLGRTMYRRNY